MKCAEAHVVIGAEPGSTTPELEHHLHDCAACAQYRREMLELDEQIRRAMLIDVDALKSDSSAQPSVRLVTDAPVEDPPRRSWAASLGGQWAVAASLLIALGVIFVLWGALPRHSLAADVVAHVISEPLPDTQAPVPVSTLEGVLQGANLRIDPLDHDVVFAQTCFLRGRLVPHFVVRSGDEVFTVLVLPDEKVKAPERFEDSGYAGVLLPVSGHGSIAVLNRTGADSEKQAQEILNALHFLAPV